MNIAIKDYRLGCSADTDFDTFFAEDSPYYNEYGDTDIGEIYISDALKQRCKEVSELLNVYDLGSASFYVWNNEDLHITWNTKDHSVTDYLHEELKIINKTVYIQFTYDFGTIEQYLFNVT